MRRFIVNRVLLSVITLVILSIIIFLGAQILPGNVGRKILGPLADQKSVDALNAKLGTNRSLIVQYWDWISGVFRGHLGNSAVQQRPVSAILGHAIVNSAKAQSLDSARPRYYPGYQPPPQYYPEYNPGRYDDPPPDDPPDNDYQE